jgi:hypothetical protein
LLALGLKGLEDGSMGCLTLAVMFKIYFDEWEL